MKAAQVRQAFLDFFAARGHERVASSALVPANDPTLLFTNAGMVQFKDVFTGHESRSIRRATTSQKCVRAGGKHNDLDEVGKTARHHTFFEMLGNFSFGDYFKEDAISWAWELLTETFKIDKNRLVITVFGGDKELGLGADDEARAIWKKVTGFGDERIIGMGKADNFWMMGETGPMGPCSEIHYYVPGETSAVPTIDPATWPGWLEIWNLVFMQYERKVAGGTLDPLPAPSIDTGAGLERVTAVLQGAQSNYDTDLFQPLLHTAAELAGKRYGANESDDVSMRVIADHARASAFLIADGVFPDKTGRDYVLRRIFRRAVRHGKLLGIEEPFMHKVCAKVIEEMSSVFPELRERARVIEEVTLEEEKRFRATLDRGLNLLEDEFTRMRAQGETTVAGAKVFQLYDTFGFPEDLTEIIAGENGFRIDHDGYQAELTLARERSRFVNTDSEAVATVYKDLATTHGATHFRGYERPGVRGEARVVAIVVDGSVTNVAKAGDQVAIICDETPFYGESGGQMGDAGEIVSANGARIQIIDTKKPTGDLHVHLGEVLEGKLAVGEKVSLTVDETRRNQIRANHSATHLLNLALKKVLGDHVAQKGSLVAPERLRFDFAHFGAMTAEQVREVEDLVNNEIVRNGESTTEVLPISVAKERGAVAMFGEKYGESVRVVGIGHDSLEFCGGTHVSRAGDIGLFKILGEAGVAQGVRRIEAVTQSGALAYVRRVEGELAKVGALLKIAPLEAATRVEKLTGDMKAQDREIGQLKAKLAAGGSQDLMAAAKEINGVKVLAVATEVDDPKTLRDTGDALRDRIGSGVILLAGVGADRVSLIAIVTKDLTKRFHAGKLLGLAAEAVGGKGGGRPDMAQGGGKDPSKVAHALAACERYVAENA